MGFFTEFRSVLDGALAEDYGALSRKVETELRGAPAPCNRFERLRGLSFGETWSESMVWINQLRLSATSPPRVV